MSCTSCGNLGSNCSCSDNCPYKTSDITLFDGSFNVLEVPCDASLNDVLALLESYTTNMVNELEDSVTYVLANGNCLGLAAGSYGFQQIMTALIDTVCNFSACAPSVAVSETGPFALLATPTGGVAPYTYQWSVADNLGAVSISGSSTNADVALAFGESFFNIGLVKVTITDSLGCIASDTFLYGFVA